MNFIKIRKKRIIWLMAVLAFFNLFFFNFVHSDDDDDDEESSSQKSSAPIVTTRTSSKVIIYDDTDGDGILDADDPNPEIAEIYIVKDDNRNGIVDTFESYL